jgi:DNA-binding transcriptional LysR family regulator
MDVSDAVAAAVAAGGGLGLSATYVAAGYVKRGELVPVLHEYAHTLFQITALWPESRRGNPNVKAFVSFLPHVFPASPPWDMIVDAAAHRR